ncbi:MAG: hypothetical protein OXC06_03420, partial [Acidimicrobiaceae bacterium]|nr:hypothetical protein [Acidimicrobiaceae bacterium]
DRLPPICGRSEGVVPDPPDTLGLCMVHQKPSEAQVIASIGFWCAVSSPVFFVTMWFGVPYAVSVATLFGGLGLSTTGLVLYRRLTDRSRVRAAVGAIVSVVILPLFLLFDYELGRHDFSCWSSIFWSC